MTGPLPSRAAQSGAAYVPLLGLRGFHRMTLAGLLARRDVQWPVPHVERRQFVVDEATSVVCLCSWQESITAPAIVLVHGLGGHADRPYMRGMARRAWSAGFHVVRLNLRCCGGTEALAGSLFHAGQVEDLRAVVEELAREQPSRPLHLVGFSMGGNIVVRLGGLWGDAPPPQVASLGAVSPSLDLARCAEVLDGRLALAPYRWSFLQSLRAIYRQRAALFPQRYDVRRVWRARTLRAFDSAATAPEGGFPDVDTYYREASAGPLVGRIRVRTLVLHARDDLIAPLDPALEDELRQAPCVQLEVSAFGGHCAFLSQPRLPPDGDRSWAEHRMLAWLGDGAAAGDQPTRVYSSAGAQRSA